MRFAYLLPKLVTGWTMVVSVRVTGVSPTKGQVGGNDAGPNSLQTVAALHGKASGPGIDHAYDDIATFNGRQFIPETA